jgi:hypothetical protein
MSTATQRWISRSTTETGSILTVAVQGRPLVPTLFDGAGWFTLDDNGRTPPAL